MSIIKNKRFRTTFIKVYDDNYEYLIDIVLAFISLISVTNLFILNEVYERKLWVHLKISDNPENPWILFDKYF